MGVRAAILFFRLAFLNITFLRKFRTLVTIAAVGKGCGFVFLVTVLLLLIACNKDKAASKNFRSYTEIVFRAPVEALQYIDPLDEIIQDQVSLDEVSYSKIPQGWIEKRNKGSQSLRFVSFESEQSGLEISLVSFPGKVGGIEANLSRWMKQLNLLPEKSLLASLAASLPVLTSLNNIPYVLVDFVAFANSPDSENILVAMMRFRDDTLFIKMQGKRSLIELERERFLAFVNALTLSNKG